MQASFSAKDLWQIDSHPMSLFHGVYHQQILHVCEINPTTNLPVAMAMGYKPCINLYSFLNACMLISISISIQATANALRVQNATTCTTPSNSLCQLLILHIHSLCAVLITFSCHLPRLRLPAVMPRYCSWRTIVNSWKTGVNSWKHKWVLPSVG